MSITVTRTLDTGLCLDILTNKSIFESISEDGADFNSLKVDVIGDTWLALHTDNNVIGCLQLKQKYHSCYHAHIHILPEFRKECSQLAGNALVEWFESNAKDCVIYVETPSFCENVLLFLSKFGFDVVGNLKNAYKKNGKQNDIIILSRGF